MIRIKMSDGHYELERVPLCSQSSSVEITRTAAKLFLESDNEQEVWGPLIFEQISFGMYLIYRRVFDFEAPGVSANQFANTLLFLAQMRKGYPPVQSWNIVFGDAFIVSRHKEEWCGLTPLQLGKLKDLVGPGWDLVGTGGFESQDFKEVVTRNGNIKVGAHYLCMDDDCFWGKTVHSIFDAILQRARNGERLIFRTYPEGAEGTVYEHGDEINFVDGGDLYCSLMNADDFCTSFVDGIERFAACDPSPNAKENYDAYTTEMQAYIKESVATYRSLTKKGNDDKKATE